MTDRAQMGPTPRAPVVGGVTILIGMLVYNHFGVDGAVTYGLLVALVILIALASTVAPTRFS